MSINKNLLTNADKISIDLNDSNYINNKGAKLYKPESYAESVEYYRLATAMGNTHSISNLGYCYLYGRGIEADLSLAIAYFKIAIKYRDVDAAYKLGDMYTDLDTSYQFLKHAEIGYERELMNGNTMYQKSSEGVMKLLNSNQFDGIRGKYEDIF